jgi:hypothetical protein
MGDSNAMIAEDGHQSIATPLLLLRAVVSLSASELRARARTRGSRFPHRKGEVRVPDLAHFRRAASEKR